MRPSPASGRALHRASRTAAIVALAAAVAVAVACGSTSDTADGGQPAAGDTLAIGVALNPKRPGMESIYQGVELAVTHLNAGRGNAAPLAVRRTDPDVVSAVQIAAELQHDPRVLAVVGHPESGTSLEALPVYEDAEHGGEHAVAIVSPTATSPQLTGRSPWFFRICPTDAAASKAVARFVVDTLQLRRAAIIYRNDSYGRDWTEAFVATFRAAGGTVLQRDPYVSGATEWAAYADYIKAIGAEVLLFPGSAEDAALAIRALRSAGAHVAFVGGDAASGLEDEGDEFAGARYTAFFDPDHPGSPVASGFIDAYRAAYGRLPDQRAALAYDAAMLIGQAIRDGGASRRDVRDYLATIGLSRPAAIGAAGRIAFDTQHDAVDKTVVISMVSRR